MDIRSFCINIAGKPLLLLLFVLETLNPTSLFIIKMNPDLHDGLIHNICCSKCGNQDLQTFWIHDRNQLQARYGHTGWGFRWSWKEASLTHVFLVKDHQSFEDELEDCINLDHVTTTLHTDLDPHQQIAPCSEAEQVTVACIAMCGVGSSLGATHLLCWGHCSMCSAPRLWLSSCIQRPAQTAENPWTAWLQAETRTPLPEALQPKKKCDEHFKKHRY